MDEILYLTQILYCLEVLRFFMHFFSYLFVKQLAIVLCLFVKLLHSKVILSNLLLNSEYLMCLCCYSKII